LQVYRLTNYTAAATSIRAKTEDENAAPFYNGVDLSYLPQAESTGFQYRASKDGDVGDAVKIVAANGANIVRLRIWNDPPYPNQVRKHSIWPQLFFASSEFLMEQKRSFVAKTG
jgi:arabinogalactan endo-1,4-beta-galactosidase